MPGCKHWAQLIRVKKNEINTNASQNKNKYCNEKIKNVSETNDEPKNLKNEWALKLGTINSCEKSEITKNTSQNKKLVLRNIATK